MRCRAPGTLTAFAHSHTLTGMNCVNTGHVGSPMCSTDCTSDRTVTTRLPANMTQTAAFRGPKGRFLRTFRKKSAGSVKAIASAQADPARDHTLMIEFNNKATDKVEARHRNVTTTSN
mmetsp:Transcript_1671/g.3434  ORF Transcript_1671/g.3434 Transcript_1671/m.3434 type:complete len:118 (-) Transcript_1671:304-657(-)